MIDLKTIDTIKAENPGTALFRVSIPDQDVQVIARRPTRVEILNSSDLEAKGKGLESSFQIVRSCVLYPSGAELDELLEERPLISTVIAAELGKLAGAAEQAHTEKL